MSEVPELRTAVRVSAERRYRRRRRRLVWRSLPVMAVAVALVAALVLLPDAAPDEVPAVPPPQTTPTPTAAPPTENTETLLASLGSVYGVFRHPLRARDRVDGFLEGLGLGVTLDLTGMRQLATFGDFKLYGVPGVEQRNGQTVLCVVTLRRARPAGASCGPFDPDQANTRPLWSKTLYRPASLYWLLVPDGTDTVSVHLKSGEVLTRRVQDNAVLFTIKGLDRITWRGADGTTYSTRAAI